MNTAALALAALPSMYPARLRHLLAHHSPDSAWALLRGRGPIGEAARHIRDVDQLYDEAAVANPDAIVQACERASVAVTWRGEADYPAELRGDSEAPEVLFSRGRLGLCSHRRVGIIGTRNASAAGRATARQLGFELAEAGVAVVSGLARGIDAAAHLGVCDAGGAAIGVVGNGLDIPYPTRNTNLWRWVGNSGLLISEWPPGTQPEGWRFPLRNRIIAALSEVLVVVESRARGGSLITARAALDRGVDVLAVPGAPQCATAAGTNRLVKDGAGLVESTADVLDALSLAHGYRGQTTLDVSIVEPTGIGADILHRCRERPRTFDELASTLGYSLVEVARGVAELDQRGWLREINGWFEPTRAAFADRLTDDRRGAWAAV